MKVKTLALVVAANLSSLALAAPNHGPSGAVTVSGIVEAGNTLIASNNLDDREGLGRISYQWLRNGQNINGATESRYTLTGADVGSRISVRASYRDGAGNWESKTSFPTGAVATAGSAPTYQESYRQKEINWAGTKWYLRDDDWNPGPPGSKHWARKNVIVDGNVIYMGLSNPTGNMPIASEMVSSRAMGYGTYETSFHGHFHKFDPYTVFGFFTFEWGKSIPGNREIDGIEVSRWGTKILKGVFTYYPTTAIEEGIRMLPGYFWKEGVVRHVSMKLDWRPHKITWTLRDAETGAVLYHTESTKDVPTSNNQQIHFNLWTYVPRGDNGWQRATSHTVALESFNYTPISKGWGVRPAAKKAPAGRIAAAMGKANAPVSQVAGVQVKVQPVRDANGNIKNQVNQVALAPKGAMLDVARQFYSLDELKAFIDDVAAGGGKFFHLHLSDNENYTLESAVLGQTAENSQRNGDGSYTGPLGNNFYSKEQIVQLNHYASAKGVQLIPEIDLPGHADFIYKLLQRHDAARAAAAFDGKNKEAAAQLAQELYGEAAEQFSASKYFHMGGNDFAGAASQNADYIAYVNGNSQLLKSKGLQPMIWNDGVLSSSLGKLDKAVTVSYHTGGEGLASAAELEKAGYQLFRYGPDAEMITLWSDKGKATGGAALRDKLKAAKAPAAAPATTTEGDKPAQ